MLTVSTETEALARLVALKTGRTPEDVVREASARALGVTGNEAEVGDRQAMIAAANSIARRAASRPILNTRSEDEILGLSEFEIPA